MSDLIFWWTGAIALTLAALAGTAFVIASIWFNLIHGRFSAIFFHTSPRRISLASWHQSKLVKKGGEHSLDEWLADDHVIGPRPFYISYRIGDRRLFFMAGTLRQWRNSSIKGTHP